eukprot:SM000140S00626  [mRNA]  locus=s140:304400:305020:- [translate_table: standard]
MAAAGANLELRFKKAAHLIRNGPPQKGVSNDVKLQYYSLFKQATEGDVTASQPSFIQIEARSKWSAWDKLKGMSKEEAMQKYIDLVAKDDADWEQHPVLSDFKA